MEVSAIVLVLTYNIIMTKSSLMDTSSVKTVSDPFLTPAVDTNEIFFNSMTLLEDDASAVTGKTKDVYITNEKAQISIKVDTTTTSTTKNTPNPRYITEAALNKTSNNTTTTTTATESTPNIATTTSTTTTTTTPDSTTTTVTATAPDTTTIPTTEDSTTVTTSTVTTTTKKTNIKTRTFKSSSTPVTQRPRGVLDLIFPAGRVKNFKNIFEKLRRMLSYTFKK